MAASKRAIDDIISPVFNPKSAKKVVRSPDGLSPMASLATGSPIQVEKMDMNATLDKLKEHFGEDIDDKALQIATYIMNECNQRINGCIEQLEVYYECHIKLENQQAEYNSLVSGMRKELDSLKSKMVYHGDKIDS